MTDEEKAEEYIIAKYKLNECYTEDTEETRVYMRSNVHSEYQQEYECYLDGLEESSKELLSKTEQLEKENEELKEFAEKLSEQHADEWEKQQEVITELKAHCKAVDEVNEKMKRCTNCDNYSEQYGLCIFSGGDEDYHCRNRKWELKE